MEDIAADMVVVERDRHAVVLLCGEIDCHSGPELRSRLLALAASAHRPLVLDMGGVSFCDGTALRMIAEAERECARRGVRMAVVGLRPFLANLFRAVGFDERLPLCRSLDEALWRLLPPTDEDIHAWLDRTP